jgi:hypothetical protein
LRTILSILLITILIGESVAQIQSNRYARITKQEFRNLLIDKTIFVPEQLGDTVVIVRYSAAKLLQMQDKARKSSFAKNGIDTIGLKIESMVTERDFVRMKTNAQKFSVWRPENIRKKLKKRGIEALIVDETDLNQNISCQNKFWFKTLYICDQKSPEDNGWLMTIADVIYDPKSNRNREVFLPINYSVFDLIK